MENKPYKNYARSAAPTPAAKMEEVKEERVAANAVEESPSVSPVEEKTEEKVEEKKIIKEEVKPIERVNDIAETSTTKIVNVQSLNVRRSPDSDAPNVVGQLRRNEKVQVIEEVGEFSKIGDNRYVMSKYLI